MASTPSVLLSFQADLSMISSRDDDAPLSGIQLGNELKIVTTLKSLKQLVIRTYELTGEERTNALSKSTVVVSLPDDLRAAHFLVSDGIGSCLDEGGVLLLITSSVSYLIKTENNFTLSGEIDVKDVSQSERMVIDATTFFVSSDDNILCSVLQGGSAMKLHLSALENGSLSSREIDCNRFAGLKVTAFDSFTTACLSEGLRFLFEVRYRLELERARRLHFVGLENGSIYCCVDSGHFHLLGWLSTEQEQSVVGFIAQEEDNKLVRIQAVGGYRAMFTFDSIGTDLTNSKHAIFPCFVQHGPFSLDVSGSLCFHVGGHVDDPIKVLDNISSLSRLQRSRRYFLLRTFDFKVYVIQKPSDDMLFAYSPLEAFKSSLPDSVTRLSNIERKRLAPTIHNSTVLKRQRLDGMLSNPGSLGLVFEGGYVRMSRFRTDDSVVRSLHLLQRDSSLTSTSDVDVDAYRVEHIYEGIATSLSSSDPLHLPRESLSSSDSKCQLLASVLVDEATARVVKLDK